ncbi:unnamed protein product [Moneuplotes crassus]|uniref:Uncharacterized protein n=1 Tax=Euplotes crassus TaxID=5936 RepID=A0AAD1X7U9_EUPCR|nr:unnamed protein product [Moneuplotes crassus]
MMIKLASLKNKELIKETVSEYERRGNYVRIFPAPGSDEYIKYFQYQKTINKYLYKVLFNKKLVLREDIAETPQYKLNYEVPKLSSYQQVREESKRMPSSKTGISEASTSDESNKLPKLMKKKQENSKMAITEDDVLIEYVSRLVEICNTVKEIDINQKLMINKFIEHYVWANPDSKEVPLKERIVNRYNEMISRRKDLLKSMIEKEIFDKDLSNSQGSKSVDTLVEERETQKRNILQQFTIKNLEEMLTMNSPSVRNETQRLNRSSDDRRSRKNGVKNVARDVINTLVPSGKYGILNLLDTSNKGNKGNDKKSFEIRRRKKFIRNLKK